MSVILNESTFEELRIQYKPDTIEVLFIGESRPKGGMFFYNADSNLYRETKKAFDEYFGENIFILDAFKKWNYWLYDICENPVNGLNRQERNDEIHRKLPDLEKLVRTKNPKFLIVCKKGSIMKEIRKSSIMTKYREDQTIFFLPFPCCGRQKEYRSGLTNALTKIGLKKPSNSFICPKPIRWNDIFSDLCAAYQKQTCKKLPSNVVDIRETGGPPTPLILNGWVFTGDSEKNQRWIETVDWAKRHELLCYVVVEEKDKYYGS